MIRILFLVLLFSIGFSSCRYTSESDDTKKVLIPEAAFSTWNYIKQYNKAPKGNVGGRQFGNYEELLPKINTQKKKLKYREWDIYPKKNGKNRGAERLVTSSDGNAYYTADHYSSFVKLEP
jgi:ribonuclease T1